MRKIRVAAVGNHRDGYIGVIECRERHPSTTEARAHVQALVRDELKVAAMAQAIRELVQCIADEGPAFDPSHPEDHGISVEAAVTISAAILSGEPER